MLRALRHSGYRSLFLAQIVALLGTGVATVALGLTAYSLDPDHGAGILGTALAVKMVAYVVVAPVASALLVRFPRRWILIAADLIRAAAALALPFVTASWQVFVLIGLLQAASATFTPTFSSVIPDLLTDADDYTGALSLSRLAYDLEAVVSPILAAILLLVIPGTALFWGTTLGFLGSALLVAGTVIPTHSPAGEAASFLTRLRTGFSWFAGPALRPVLALNVVVAATGAFVIVQTPTLVKSSGGGDAAVALLLAALGAGSMVTALVLTPAIHRWGERRLMVGGAWLATAALGAVAWLLSLGMVSQILLAAAWFLVGAGWSAAETPVGRILRREVPSESLPAAFAAQFSLSHACWLVGYPLAGWLGAATAAAVLAAVAVAASAAAQAWWPTSRPVPSEVTS